MIFLHFILVRVYSVAVYNCSIKEIKNQCFVNRTKIDSIVKKCDTLFHYNLYNGILFMKLIIL